MLFMGVFALLGFAFGLTGGILTLRRKSFSLAIIGTSLALASGLVIVSVCIAEPYAGAGAVIFGAPTILFSTLSLIFTAISRQEFA